MKRKQNKLLPVTRECQECKHRFRITPVAQVVESKFTDYKIFCPRCSSINIAIVRD